MKDEDFENWLETSPAFVRVAVPKETAKLIWDAAFAKLQAGVFEEVRAVVAEEQRMWHSTLVHMALNNILERLGMAESKTKVN